MLSVNVQTLIYEGMACLDEMESYAKFFKEHPYYTISKQEQTWREQNNQHAIDTMWFMCSILNADQDALYAICRAVRKWEKKHNYQLCFPFSDHEAQIQSFLTK